MDQEERLKAALADRYQIERELGSGGMATVYLARDVRHERWVAVKVLHPELAAALGAERFHQEIKIAANLTHPHILPLHDSGDAEGFLYYVMPHIEGESLRDRLAKEGELPIAEVVRILRDVVDALSEAHEKGVVHRDIKPENILLTKHHALVTDFGVAKAVGEATGAHRLTTEGVALGTPAYMSPEQAAADTHIDHRADIYAVGIVAYELLTGRTPFLGARPQMILSAHITDTPDPVTKYRESVPPALEQLVMKCLEKKAADRWQAAEELLPLLEALATPSGGITPVGTMPVDRSAKRRWIVGGGAVGVAVVIAGMVAISALRRGRTGTLDERRVAVLPFTNLTGEDSLDVHGLVAASWITDGLQQVEALSVVPWTAVLPEANAMEGGNRVRELAEVTGAGVVVSGTYSRQGESLRFRAEITDARRMEVLHTFPESSGPLLDPEVAYEALSEQVAGALAATLDTVFTWIPLMSRPTFPAYKESVTGEDLFYRGRNREAIAHLVTAHDLDTTFIGPLLRIVPAYVNLGQFSAADSVIRLIERTPERLSSFERGWLALLQASFRGDRLEAYRISHDQYEHYQVTGYGFAYAALRINRPQEAVEILENVDPTKGRMKEWVPYWEYLTQARHMLGDHRRELKDARRGRQQHPDSRNTTEFEVRALAALGRIDEIKLVLDELPSLPPDPSWGYAYPAAVAGLEFRAHGDTNMAHELFQLSIDRLRSHVPDEASRRAHLYNLAQTLYWDGQWDESRGVFLQLSGEDPDDLDYRGYLGVVSARLNDLEAASRISNEMAMVDGPYLWGRNTLWRARIEALLGHREQAVELLRRAFNEGRTYGIWLHRDTDLESLRDYPPFQELIRPKG